MKTKLWIFGDSFADPNYNPTNNFLVYHYALEKHFEVQNYAKAGSGPEWSLQTFLRLDREMCFDEKKNTNILFIASDWTRFNFKFIKDPTEQVFALRSALGRKKYPFWAKYKKYINFIDWFIRYYVDYNDTFALQNMLLVKHYSRHYNKCIYWPVFTAIEKEVRELYNSKNFYIPDYILDTIHIPEPFGKGTYPNHMSKESHDKVYQLVIDVFNETS